MTVSILSSIFCLIKKKSSAIPALLVRRIIRKIHEKRVSRVHEAIKRFFRVHSCTGHKAQSRRQISRICTDFHSNEGYGTQRLRARALLCT